MKKLLERKTVYRFVIVMMAFALSGCAWVQNKVKDIKGELIGNHFTIDFYDHFGSNTLTIEGSKVGLKGNYVDTVNSAGEVTKELSSIISLTVDGHPVEQTGSTVIFAEDGITKLEDFKLPDKITTEGGTINILDRKINDFKNLMGTPRVIVVCSQLGIPIAVYGGKEVYWEVPSDLPKTTKLKVDGLALYIHRSDFILIDGKLIK